MKPFFLSALSLFCLLALAPASSAGQVEAEAIQVKVPDMACVSCASHITSTLKKLESVSDVHVDAVSKVALIETKAKGAPGKKVIFDAIKKAGYEPKGYEVLSVNFAEAKATLAKKG